MGSPRKPALALVTFGTMMALAASDALAAPPGLAISYGANPIVTYAGTVAAGASASTIFTAPTGQEVVITDVVFVPLEQEPARFRPSTSSPTGSRRKGAPASPGWTRG